MIIRDKDLTTEIEIRSRVASIHRQREELCATPKRSENHTQFVKRQEKIAKLTAREDALRIRLRDAIQSGATGVDNALV